VNGRPRALDRSRHIALKKPCHLPVKVTAGLAGFRVALGYTPTRHLTRNRLSVALRSGRECPQTPQAPYGRAEHQAGGWA